MNENVVKLENSFNQSIERKIAVIFVTDVVGFSKLMENNEDQTLQSFRACKDILDNLFKEHGGRIFNTAGDSVLSEFQSAVSAVVCANEFQKLLKERNNSVSDDAKMNFRIGLNMGDVIVEGENLYGDGVNVAARLEALSQPGGVCLSKSIMDFVNRKTELLFNDLGEQKVKNTLVHAFDLANSDLEKRSDIDNTTTAAASAKIVEGSVPPTIAVLPFANLSTDPEQDFFADGITEDTISYLSKSKTFPLVSLNSVMSYKDSKDSSKSIAEGLGADYLVHGSIRKGGNKVRITAKLTDALEDIQIWSQTWDRSLDDVFEVQDEVSQKVAALALPAIIINEQKTLNNKDLKIFSAWDEYLHSLNSYDKSSEAKNVEEKINYVYEAIEHAEKSIALNKNLTDSYNVLASCLFFLRIESSLQHDREKNESRFREVAEKSYNLDPYNPDSVMNMAYLFRISDDETKYREFVNKAVEINPHHSRSLYAKGMLYLNESDYDNSIELLNRANESNRKEVLFYETMLFFCHLGKNDWVSANQSVDRSMRNNDHSRYHAFKAVILAKEGKIEESKQWLKKYQDNRPEIKTLEDYEKVVPQINQEVKDILLDGMRNAGLK
ncbi:MAG: adenylate/guanylate cyclase domain-containing protein [Candidatus Puniceispirillales bacterium]